MRLRFCLAVLVLGQATSALAQTPRDVPRDHWAYDSVQALAARGLIKGFPPDGNFFGSRTVTRYEMASLVERVAARVEELLAAKADKREAPAPGVRPGDLAELRKLIDEFKVELAVTGADVKQLREQLDQLRSDVGDLRQRAQDQAGQIAAARAEAADANKRAQAAADDLKKQAGRLDKVETGKVDAGFGRIKLDGLIQTWITAEKDAPDRGQVNTYRMRRTEIKLSGSINPKAYWAVMFDPAKSLGLNVTGGGAAPVTGVSVNHATNILQDAFVGLSLGHGLAFEAGQQKLPLSMEGLRSSAQLLTVERAIFNTLPANNGRVGDVREPGATLRYTSPTVSAEVAVVNDGGSRQNTVDDNNRKEIIWHAQYKGVPHLLVGAYQALDGGINGPLATQRHRLGAELAFLYGPHTLEAEWVQGRDAVVSGGAVTNSRLRSHGGYVLYGYRLSPAWQLIARGEYWNPNRDLHGAAHTREYDLTLGVNYYLVGHNAKLQFNWVRKDIVGPLNSAGSGPAALPALGLARSLFLANFQQAF